ncbi:MAG: response regulator [Methylococcales bacterium]|nr:response regulator [Methylococcales bacterium]
MKTDIHQHVTNIRREYNSFVANETMEDYALRYAPRSFRKWSEFEVANAALGSTAFLVLEAIGGFLSINYGFTNAVWAILAVTLIIFITSFPISYYAARYHIDIDLLTRSAGFGYIGSTVTSLIYASFTFTLFALEASIMSLALELYFHIPLAIAHVISAILVIPLVTFGITTISRVQLWTQPLWLILFLAPYIAIAQHEPNALNTLTDYFWSTSQGVGFDWMLFGTAATVAFSMMAQIGEQVDFLRFMPDKTPENKVRWWLALLAGGPGWVLFGAVRQILGALLADLAIHHGISPIHAHEPTQMYLTAYKELFVNPKLAIAGTTLFVIISQIKINVTNAYAGSLAWSNFFSRLTHSHPGRVIWLLFNVLIALLLMEFGVFSALEKVLGLFSHMSIAWICRIAAELMINKPLGLSPNMIEFKRAYLPDLNPVGIISTLTASLISILAYADIFGEVAKAFSGFIALGLAFILTPTMAWLFGKKHYIARDRNKNNVGNDKKCTICENTFEHEDMAYCPAYRGSICSLCCTLDARCLDVCKTGFRFDDYLRALAERVLPSRIKMTAKLRLLRFALMFLFLSVLTGIFISIIYYQDLLTVQHNFDAFQLLLKNFFKIYASLLVFIGLCTWWLILNAESRQVAQQETAKQTQLLLLEIEKHKKTDSKLQETMRIANSANQAKSRFLSNMSHEIRSPLNSIVGYSYILQKDPTIPEHRRQAVDTLKRSGEHLSALIEDILDIARIEARKFELSYEAFDFHALIEHLVNVYKTQAEDKGLYFNCKIINTLPKRIKADEKRVGQILINILSNAIKFTQTGGILFSISYSAGVAKFEITDTGDGMDEKQLQVIFEPFTRLNTVTGNAISGSGLGLTISKILAEIMGGELNVVSQVGVGSTFTVRLFLANLGTDSEHYATENITGYQGKRLKILTVDDQSDHRELIKSLLTPLGFLMSEASSGEDCLERIAELQPDLILLDLAMTGIDGTETAYQLRLQKYLIPIIILSANAYPADRVKAMNAGASDFLAKPIQVQNLLNKLKLHLGLTWVYQTDTNEPTINTIEPPLIRPTDEIISALMHFVRIGDLRSLVKHIDNLSTQHPEYHVFFEKIKQFAKDFRMAEIKKLLL